MKKASYQELIKIAIKCICPINFLMMRGVQLRHSSGDVIFDTSMKLGFQNFTAFFTAAHFSQKGALNFVYFINQFPIKWHIFLLILYTNTYIFKYLN